MFLLGMFMIDYENFLLRMFMIGYEKRNVGLAVSYYKICGDKATTITLCSTKRNLESTMGT